MIKQLRSPALLLLLLAACGGPGNMNGGGGGGGGGIDAPTGSNATPDAATTTPDAPDTLPTGVYAIPLGTPTGQDQGSFYTAPLTASGATFQLDLDSGSTTTGVAGMGCTTCTGLSPLYTPGSGATNQNNTASTQYADGSGWSGEIYADTVGLGAGSPTGIINLVSITQQSQFFSGNEYQGILGVGPDALLETGTTSYVDAMTQAGVTDIMAYELCPTSGTLWLGGFDPSHAQGDPQYTPLLATGANAAFYSLDMTDMGIGGTSLGFGSSTFDSPIVDTGTSLFYVPTAVQTALISKVNASPGFKAVFPNQTLSASGSGCVMAAAGTTDATVDAMLPEMSMSFAKAGGGSFTVSAKASVSYLMNSGGGQYCLVVEGGGDGGQGTMGDTILRAFVTVIDLQHKQIGFAPEAHCAAPLALDTTPRGPLREHGRGPHHVHPAH